MSQLFNNEQQSKLYLSRPVYTDNIIEDIINFWKGYNDDAKIEHSLNIVDVGCGSGQLTFKLIPYARKIMGIDTSEHQINNAELKNTDVGGPRFMVGNCEALPVGDNSVDLITVAQAFHWFDIDKFYHEVDRCLKPAGVLSILNHGKGYIIGDYDHTKLEELNKFVSYEFWFDDLYLGPYVTEKPRWAWKFLAGLKLLYPTSGVRLEDKWSDMKFSVQRYGEYLRSSSMYQAWKDDNLDSEDLVELTLHKILAFLGQPEGGLSTEFVMRFPLCMIMCSKPQA